MTFSEAPALLASGLALVYSSLKVITAAPWAGRLRLDTDRDPSASPVGREAGRHVRSTRSPDLRRTQRTRGWQRPSARKFSCRVMESRLAWTVRSACAVLLLPLTATGTPGHGLADMLQKH